MKKQCKSVWQRILAYGLIVVCLTGCTNPSSNTTTNPIPTSDIDEIASSEIAADTAPTHIVESISDDLCIDATVVGYPSSGKAGVYYGFPKVFTAEDIEAFVNHCGESIMSVKKWDDGDMMYYNGECSDGYRFSYMRGLDGVNHHPYAEFRFFDTNRYMTYYDYPIYSAGEENYITNPQYTVGWMFTEQKEFSFSTEAEAETTVRDALEILGLPDLTLLRTLYIDHNTLEEAGKLLSTDDAYAPIGEAVENNGYVQRDDWSEEDDAYMFNFGISVAGTPMSYLFDDSGETATYCGSEVIVWYTKYGITSLSILTPWSVDMEYTSPEIIVSAQDALEVVKEKYSYDLSRENKQIEEVRLIYKYSQDRNCWLLRPTWVVRTSYSRGDSDDRYYEFMYVDALTGQEL